MLKTLHFSGHRGGKYPEDDAKAIVVQILNVVSFCHLQGVVHRDLKPEVSLSLFLNFPSLSHILISSNTHDY